jgi:hypothetical protein
MRWFAGYVLLASGAWGLLTWAANSQHYALLAADGYSTSATVVELHCENHGVFTFQYLVGGHRYIGVGHARDIGQACSEVRVGQGLEVTYARSAPQFATSGDPEMQLQSQRESRFIAVALLVLLLLAIQLKYWKNDA